MNKAEFVKAVAEKTGSTKKDASIAVNAVLDTVVETLKSGDDISIVGFGKFYVTDVAERQGHNPQTGETMVIEAHKAPKFKFGKAVKDEIC